MQQEFIKIVKLRSMSLYWLLAPLIQKQMGYNVRNWRNEMGLKYINMKNKKGNFNHANLLLYAVDLKARGFAISEYE